MKRFILSGIAALGISSPTIAQDSETRTLYTASEDDRFRAEVRYSRQADGREVCLADLLDRRTKTVLSVLVPGDRREVGVIIFGFPNGILGVGGPPEADILNVEFVEPNGEPETYSAQGFWNFGIEEVHQQSASTSYVLLIRVDDFWAFARDWYDSAAVFVTNGRGEEMGSMTLYRPTEVMQALADCWSETDD